MNPINAPLEVRSLVTGLRRSNHVVPVVDGLSLRLERATTLGLVGESGCGKTMTALSVMRLLPPGVEVLSGQILVNGRDVATLGESKMRQMRGRHVSAVFQDPMTSLTPTMTVGHQVSEALRVQRGRRRVKAMVAASELLSLVGLPRPRERLGDYPHQLSGGQRQRVLIAMALAGGAPLLIADEPTTALDVTIQAQILELLDDLKGRLGMALLLITHDMGVIAGRTDFVAVMYAGRIVEEAPTTELFGAPHHPYTEGLLASIPRQGQDASEPLSTIPGLPPNPEAFPPGCRFAPRCRYATDRCRAEDPPLTDPSGMGHAFACHHPVGFGPSVETAAPIRLKVPQQVSPPVKGLSGADAPVLEVTHLVKEFPVAGEHLIRRSAASVKAVSDVSFVVARGETLGLVGESGSGKTTLARMVVALEVPTSGTVRVQGSDLASLKRRPLRRARRLIQPVFQDSFASLDPRMRVRTSISEPLVIQGIGTRTEQAGRVDDLLAEVGLSPETAKRHPHQLSGGQRQRVALARALALQPDLIVADEPVSALDVSVRAQILNLMHDLQRARGLSYLFISHDLSVVRYLADRIGVMYLGKLVELGSSRSVYDHPAHPYTASLIRAIPDPDPVAVRLRRSELPIGDIPSPIDPPSGCRFRTRCPKANDICKRIEPPLRQLRPGQLAACHFPL